MKSIILFCIVSSIILKECESLRTSRLRHRNDDYHSDSDDNLLEHEPLPVVDNEQPRPARPYRRPGHWATPAPDSGIDLGFTPVQIYAQVRRTKTVQHLPQSDAIHEASSPDEVLNAHRLKEVLRTKKIQEVYSEEGYEDSGYDHGDEERYAEHDEGFAKHKNGKHRLKDPVQEIQDVADAESSVVERRKKGKSRPKVDRKRVETSSMKFSYMNDATESPPRKHKRAPKVPTAKRDFASSRDNFWNFPGNFDSLPKWPVSNLEPITRRKEKVGNEKKNRVRIPPIPSVGYIHSLTDAHYGTQSPMIHQHPKPIPSHVINLTDGFKPDKKSHARFEAKRIQKRIKREIDDESHKQETEDYEKELSKNLDEQKKIIIGSALNNIDFKPYNKFPSLSEQMTPPRQHIFKPVTYDKEKYPYFNNPSIETFSPLRYASHPREFPKKSGYGMEFYENKDREIDCDPIDVSLDDTPKENSTKDFAEQPGEKKRIVGLGDKIQCLKIKYFGQDPLDSPFFKEDELKKQYHSTYQYQPNKTLDIYLENKRNDSVIESSQQQLNYEVIHSPRNQTETPRLIPVQEVYEPQYPALTTASPIMGMKPPPLKYQYLPLSVLVLPPRPKPQKIMKSIKFRQNCLQPITKVIISERSDEDIMYECNDVTLIRTTRDGNPHIKIMPKLLNRRTKLLLDESNDLRAGEVFEYLHRTKRSEPTARRKSQLFPNKSLLDKLIKRPTVERKPKNASEVDLGVNSPNEESTTQTVSSTVKAIVTTTTTQAPPALKIPPKPLTRLSGQDFLTRYHKSRGSKNRNVPKTDEFWSVGSSTERAIKNQQPKPTQSDEPQKISRRVYSKSKRDETGTTPVLLYVVDATTGEGQWVRDTTTTEATTVMNRRQLQKQTARRVFFNKKLKNE